MWDCPKCREAVDQEFDVCWNCGTGRDGTVDPQFKRVTDDASVPDASFDLDYAAPFMFGDSERAASDALDASDTLSTSDTWRAPDSNWKELSLGRWRAQPPVMWPRDSDWLVPVISFWHPVQAWLARSRLVDAGIPAFVEGDHTVGVYWLCAVAVGGVKVLVPLREFAREQAVLDEDRSGVLPSPSGSLPGLTCPQCLSAEVYTERYRRRAAFVIWLLVGFPLAIRRRTWICLRCGWTDRPPFRVPTQFGIRHLLILMLVLSILLSILRTLALMSPIAPVMPGL
jgi:hypothetical protein